MREFWGLLRTDRPAAVLGAAGALLLLLNLAAVPVLDLPLRERTLAREEALYAVQGELRALRQAGGRAQAARNLEEEIGRLRASFPSRREVVALVRDLSARAASTHLKVGSINYKPTEVPEEELLTLAIAMGLEGRYGDLRRFLAGLDGLRGRVTVTHLAATGRPGEGHVTARLNLTAYFRAGETRPRARVVPTTAAEDS